MRRVGGVVVSFCVVAAGCGQLLGVDGLTERDADVDAQPDVVVVVVDASAPEVCATQSGPCSLFPFCGCDAGQNCVVANNVSGHTTCVDDAGTTPQWWPCGANTDCQPGMACIGAVCKPYCGSAADCPNGTCEQVRDNSNGKLIPGFFVCSSGCDLMNPSAICGPDVTCYPYPWDGGPCHGDCAGTSGDADTCSGNNNSVHTDCALGFYCLADKTCKKWCRTSHANGDCADGGVCIGFSGAGVYIGAETYGLCD